MSDVPSPDTPDQPDDAELDEPVEVDDEDDGPPTGEQGAEGDADGRPRSA